MVDLNIRSLPMVAIDHLSRTCNTVAVGELVPIGDSGMPSFEWPTCVFARHRLVPCVAWRGEEAESPLGVGAVGESGGELTSEEVKDGSTRCHLFIGGFVDLTLFSKLVQFDTGGVEHVTDCKKYYHVCPH